MHVMNPSQAIEALRKNGWTDSRIADDVGTFQSTITRIRKGMPTAWELGNDLIQLANDNLPKRSRKS